MSLIPTNFLYFNNIDDFCIIIRPKQFVSKQQWIIKHRIFSLIFSNIFTDNLMVQTYIFIYIHILPKIRKE